MRKETTSLVPRKQEWQREERTWTSWVGFQARPAVAAAWRWAWRKTEAAWLSDAASPGRPQLQLPLPALPQPPRGMPPAPLPFHHPSHTIKPLPSHQTLFSQKNCLLLHVKKHPKNGFDRKQTKPSNKASLAIECFLLPIHHIPFTLPETLEHRIPTTKRASRKCQLRTRFDPPEDRKSPPFKPRDPAARALKRKTDTR